MTTYSHCMECAGGNAFSIWTAGTERDIEAPFLSGGWNYQWQQMPGGQDVGGGILPGGKDPQEKKKKVMDSEDQDQDSIFPSVEVQVYQRELSLG